MPPMMENDPCALNPPREDPLGVLTGCARVLEAARHVRLDAPAAQAFAARQAEQPPTPPPEDDLHCAFLPPMRRLNYLLVLEALNFCFWDASPRWEVVWEGKRHDGYWALAAALRRAVRDDALPLWDAQWLDGLDAPALERMLRGEGRPAPLATERLRNLREAGEVLLERWGGQFAHMVENAAGSAPALVNTIAEEFPSFRDETPWQGSTVRFLKRAQICVADLTRLLAGHPLGRLEGLEHLTAFADYKVPQVLRKEGILVLSPSLAERVDRLEELAPGSEEEVEIRAATIWGCEWLARLMSRFETAGGRVTAMDVDYTLWLAGQDKTGLPPYHRTRTIYY